MRPTTEQSAAIEHEVLTTEAGRALLAEVASVKLVVPADLARWRKLASPDHVSAAIRLVEGRRRGGAKFARADRMWFEPVALEQATNEAVARHKAARFAGSNVVDLCCGLGGDAIALAGSARRVAAVDRDRGMVRRALWNAAAYEAEGRILGVVADAERFPIPPGALVHIDPDRRAGGGPRARSLDQYRPGLDFLRKLAARCRGGAIKLGPASDFAAAFGATDYEVEIVSLHGECKEATVWFGTLATARLRATALPSGATWTDRQGIGGVAPIVPLGPVLWEPDAALSRSGLLDGYAAAHGLGRPFAGIDLLTGPDPGPSPLLAPFAVLAESVADPRAVRREARRLGVAIVEVKARGRPEARPEAWRAGEGPDRSTLFLLRGPSGSRAVLTRRGP